MERDPYLMRLLGTSFWGRGGCTRLWKQQTSVLTLSGVDTLIKRWKCDVDPVADFRHCDVTLKFPSRQWTLPTASGLFAQRIRRLSLSQKPRSERCTDTKRVSECDSHTSTDLCWCPLTRLHGLTTHKTTIWTVILRVFDIFPVIYMLKIISIKSSSLEFCTYILMEKVRTVVIEKTPTTREPTSHGGGSVPCRVVWDFWWTNWRHWGTYSPRTSISPASFHFSDCFTFISYRIIRRCAVQIITNSMEMGPSWENASCAATQEILSIILLNPNVHCRFLKSTPLDPILSQTTLVHTTLPYLSKIHFNIIYPPTYWSS
jgi:hypothetical protein